MKRVLVGIKIKELTPSGMVEVFELETEEVPMEDNERMEAAFDQLTSMIMEKDSFFMQTNQGSIIIRGLSRKTIKLQGVFREVAENVDD